MTDAAGRVLSVVSDPVEIHYLSDIDAAWRFTDAAGHRHRCEYDAAEHWPTLREIADQTWWCDDCRDEHTDTHWECRLCGEHIRPGMTGPGTKLLPGPVTYYIGGEIATADEARAFAESLRP
jgi:hypothetical protein